MIPRTAQKTLLRLASQFKATAVTGPRQSGKTTLTRATFPGKSYVNLENPDTRLFATEDPRGFLAQFPEGAILDEVQRQPAIFSYLQQILDESTEQGRFILTGSNNFLLQEGISQTLAGRIASLTLLPFSVFEPPNAAAQDVNSLFFPFSIVHCQFSFLPNKKFSPLRLQRKKILLNLLLLKDSLDVCSFRNLTFRTLLYISITWRTKKLAMQELRNTVAGPPGDEIDLVEVARRLWKGRRTISLLVFFSLATGLGWYTYRRFILTAKYESKVILLVESSPSSGDLLMARADDDAEEVRLEIVKDSIPFDLYPLLLTSTPFLQELMEIRITDPKNGQPITLSDYLAGPGGKGDPVELLKEAVSVTTDPSGTLAIRVVLPDPSVAAPVADSLAVLMAPFITRFATAKAAENLKFINRLQAEAEHAAQKALQEISDFHNRKTQPLLTDATLEEKRLQANWQIAYDRQSLLSREAEKARFRIQSATPSVTVMQPATPAARANLPNLLVILLVSVFAGFIIGGGIAFIKIPPRWGGK